MTKTKKEKEATQFIRDIKKAQKRYTKILNPRMDYTSDYDIFSIFWGDLPSKFCIELNILGEGDLRFDINKHNIICGVEIDNFSKVMRRFDCDKEPFKSEIEARMKEREEKKKREAKT